MSSTDSKDIPYWIAWSRLVNVGPKRTLQLARSFPTMEDAWRASLAELMSAGIEQQLASELVIQRNDINPQKEFSKCITMGIDVITFFDDQYPQLLKEIPQPPAQLFVRGTLKPHQFPLGVVGTRKISPYGTQIMEKIVRPLATAGVTIISGLALGVDGRGHEIALEENSYTIAVLGCGIDDQSIYPSPHRFLAKKIIESGGAMISEFPPGTLPLPHHFPMRNRIISGLSKGTLVIEAAEKSGSLITARAALDQNRNVYAIPGSILNQASGGTNALIKIGAKCVTELNDILEDFELIQTALPTLSATTDDPTELLLLSLLGTEPLHIDDILTTIQIPAPTAMSHLTILETMGMVKQVGFMKYVKM